MIRPAEQHATRRGRPPSRGFARYDGCRFAMLVRPLLGDKPLLGTAHFQRDDLLGNVLRISLDGDDPGHPEVLVAEDQWQGLITSGAAYGCQYCLSLPWQAS